MNIERLRWEMIQCRGALRPTNSVVARHGLLGWLTPLLLASFLYAWAAIAHAALPIFQGAGTSVSGNGSVSPAWPTHVAGDVALLFVESAGGQAVTLSTPAGFVEVANSPQSTGTTTSGTRLTVFWARATSSSMASPTVADPGDHVYAQILTYRGVVASGNPWDVTGGGAKATASTSVTVSGVTTSVADTLVVQAVSRDNDSNNTAFTNITNGSLSGLTERTDGGTTSGNGGGVAVWDGGKATAGATGNTTASVTSSVNAFLTIALRPAPPSVVSINTASANPTAGAASVTWAVTFSENVSGVTSADFALVQGSGVTGAAITSVTGSGTTYTVTASTGSGTGTLGLNLVDDDSISNSNGIKLGGTGAGNGNFTGQAYTVTSSFCSPPSNTPAGLSLTCVCDTFGRTSLNPSTIFGSNWALSNSDNISNPYINTTTGLLRLTENTNNNAKAATVPGIFPAAGNYISVEFLHYAYRGTTTGADGIAVTLSDYSIPAVPGGFGGSLGYAQRNDGSQPPGFAGGWVGVALDEYGNYSNPTEGRVARTGAANQGFYAQEVGVRGPGSGANGYRFLGGTGTLSGQRIDTADRTSTTPGPGYMYQVIVDARNYASGTVNVQVNRDHTTKDGSTYSSLFGPFNAYSEASYAVSQGWISQLVPDYWKISFTGSTGGSTNIHEIGSLRICAQTVYPPTGGTASGFSAIDEAYPTSTNSAPAYQYFQTGDIYTKVAGTPFKLWVAALSSTGISTAYGSGSSKYVEVKLVDNSDNACGTEAARTCSVSACYGKSPVEGTSVGRQILTYTSTQKGAQQTNSFTLNSAWKNLVAVMRECTTSACTAFSTTTDAACSVDSFAVRPTGVASVVSTNATNAATTGLPTFRAGGDSFSLTATTAGTAGYASGYTGILKINNSALQPISPALVAGQIDGTFPAATSGTPSSTATGSAFTYSEAGAFLLPGYSPATDTTSPRGVFDGVQTTTECASMTSTQCDLLKATTWTGVDSVSTKRDCIENSYANTRDTSGSFASNPNYGKYGCNFGLTSNTAAIGRFIPNEFRVSSITFTNRQAASCSPASEFSYLDEAMGLQFKLTAYSASNTIVRNYAGTLAKLSLPSGGATLNFGAAATAPFAALTSRISAQGFAASWPAANPTASGEVSLSGTVTVSSLTIPSNNRVSPDGPFNDVAIGIAPVDSDGVRILNYDLDVDNSGGPTGPDRKTLVSTDLYFGQLRFLPALGSERLPLAMRAEVLKWNGTAFVPNGDDSCTRLPSANLSLRDWQRNLSAGETSLQSSSFPSGSLAFSDGSATLRFSAPGPNNDGSVNVTADLTAAGLGYLAGRWADLSGITDTTPTKWDDNPWATATFGSYGYGAGARQIIHIRELY